MMIEAAFSIFIVGTILITFMAVMGSLYRTEFAKRDLIIATNLAQEGIEIVRNVRDNNWKTCENASFPCTDFKEAFDTPFPAIDGTNFCVGLMTGGVATCSSPMHDWLQIKLNGAPGFYGYDNPSTNPTKFSRRISISGAGGDSRTITSNVSWGGNNISISDTLYSWADVD